MYFNTLEYFGFFLLVWASLRYIPGPATILFVASIIFYIVAGWFDTTLIALLIVANWVLLSYVSTPKPRIILAVIVNVGVLVAVKYRVLLGGDPGHDPTAFVDMVLPLGISFYTFQLLAYQIDTARDAGLRERDPKTFTLFIIFFPQLIAGPIVRARQLLPQIRALSSKRSPRLRFYTYGLLLCTLGLSKKILFADSLAPIVDDIFYLGPTSTGEAWTGAWLFTFQIYFDFSGYSDIAIGSAYLLGIRLPRNFQTPYLSTSPREFWRRWHITLSTWIRDYLYIPLGGGKGLRSQQYAVLVMVMGIAGLWHGANSTFVIWGFLWGLYIALHRFFGRLIRSSPNASAVFSASVAKAFLWGCHILVVVVLWVFFRAENLTGALEYLSVMFSVPNSFSDQVFFVFIGSALLMVLHGVEATAAQITSLMRLRRFNSPFVWGFLGGLCLWLILLPSYTQNPFIYFRF